MRHIIAVTALGLIVGCGSKKSDDDKDTAAETSGTTVTSAGGGATVAEPPKDVAAVYSSISTHMSGLNSVAYNKASLRLADEAWTADDWGTTPRFNCFGECAHGSIHPKEFVGQVLDPAEKGPAGDVLKKLNVFCYIGAMFEPAMIGANGLPNAAASTTVVVSEAMKERFKTQCDADQKTLDELSGTTLNLTVEEATGAFDRQVILSIVEDGKSEDMPFYLKNSDNIVSVAMFENSKDENDHSGVSRTMFKIDLTTDVFQFENYSLIPPTDPATTSIAEAGSLNFSRGYRNGTTKDVVFIANMGNAVIGLNHTFVGISTNEGEAQGGAYFARTAADQTALEGAFACFTMADGAFVNNTGCTANAANPRKLSWSPSSDLFKLIQAKAITDWSLSATTEVAAFDATTIATLTPNFK